MCGLMMISSIWPMLGHLSKTDILYCLLLHIGFPRRLMVKSYGLPPSNYSTISMSSNLLFSISKTTKRGKVNPTFFTILFFAVIIFKAWPPVNAKAVSKLSFASRTLILSGQCRKYLILLLLTFCLGHWVPKFGERALIDLGNRCFRAGWRLRWGSEGTWACGRRWMRNLFIWGS